MPKASDAEKDRFRRLVSDLPGVEVKPMFGQLGAFINGNMFAGLFGSDVGVRLAEDDRGTLEAAGAGPFGPAERPMSGYLSLPAGTDDEAAARWIAAAAQHVAALPPKAPRKK
jgi:TfoX/Sxy family transcriptional regulator of competence genes